MGTNEHPNEAYRQIPNFDQHLQLSAQKRVWHSAVGAAENILEVDNRQQPKRGFRCRLLVHDVKGTMKAWSACRLH